MNSLEHRNYILPQENTNRQLSLDAELAEHVLKIAAYPHVGDTDAS